MAAEYLMGNSVQRRIALGWLALVIERPARSPQGRLFPHDGLVQVVDVAVNEQRRDPHEGHCWNIGLDDDARQVPAVFFRAPSGAGRKVRRVGEMDSGQREPEETVRREVQQLDWLSARQVTLRALVGWRAL